MMDVVVKIKRIAWFWQVVGNAVGQECKERRLAPHEHPVALMLLWPKLPIKDHEQKHSNRFVSLSLSLSIFFFFFFFS